MLSEGGTRSIVLCMTWVPTLEGVCGFRRCRLLLVINESAEVVSDLLTCQELFIAHVLSELYNDVLGPAMSRFLVAISCGRGP